MLSGYNQLKSGKDGIDVLTMDDAGACGGYVRKGTPMNRRGTHIQPRIVRQILMSKSTPHPRSKNTPSGGKMKAKLYETNELDVMSPSKSARLDLHDLRQVQGSGNETPW